MRRFISRLISIEAERDREKAESMNILSVDEISREVFRKFQHVNVTLIQDIVKGEVLSDARGQGSLQQVAA